MTSIAHRLPSPAVRNAFARSWRSACAVVGVVVLTACAGYGTDGLRRGDTAAQVTARMGQPTGQYKLPQGGMRLEFARGPYGMHTYMVDLDRDGRVMVWEQVLTEANFNRIAIDVATPPGLTTDDVLRRLGRPSHVRPGGWQGGQVWSYRYQATFCQWFQLGVNGSRVRDAAYGPDPLCDIDVDVPG